MLDIICRFLPVKDLVAHSFVGLRSGFSIVATDNSWTPFLDVFGHISQENIILDACLSSFWKHSGLFGIAMDPLQVKTYLLPFWPCQNYYCDMISIITMVTMSRLPLVAKYYQLTCAIPDSLYILYEH